MRTTLTSVATLAATAVMFKGEGAAGASAVMRGVGAQAPGQAPSVPTERPKANRFAALFPVISFKPVPERAPYVFPTGADQGTKQYNLADIVLENVNGIIGANQMGYRVVLRVSADDKKRTMVVVTPTYSLGPSKQPLLNLKEATDTTKEEYTAFLDTILGSFKAWAKKRVADGIKLHDGKAGAGAGAATEDASAEDLDALGFKISA